MQTRNHVTLETARKLKAAGFPQDTERVWTTPASGLAAGTFTLRDTPNTGETFAAPNSQELADELPDNFELHGKPGNQRINYLARLQPEYSPTKTQLNYVGTTIAEALAALWLATHQQGEQEGRA